MKLIFKSIYTKKETSTKCKQPENCKNQIRSLKMKFCFLKKEIKTKNPAILYSYLNSIIYTKPFCRKREKKPDSDRSNRTKLRKRAWCTILVPKNQNMERVRIFLVRIFMHSDWIRRGRKYLSVFSPNAGNVNINLLNVVNIDHVIENTSNSGSDTLMQQKEQKKFVFIRVESMVKGVGEYLLTWSIKRKFIVKLQTCLSTKTVDI